MRKKLIPLAALVLPLAACGGTEDPSDTSSGEAMSEEEIADAVDDARDAIRPEPGLYRTTMEMLEFDMPGMPANAADMMRNSMAGQSHTYCLSKEDADEGFENVARESQDNDDCRFEKFDVDDGAFDARMVCDAEGRGSMTVTMVGSGTPTRSDVEVTASGNFTGMGDSTMKMKVTHERIGDCG